MGQRTQIIIVEDVIDMPTMRGYRYVTAHYDQWGYGRPVLFDLLYAASKLNTGAYLCPHSYEGDLQKLNAYRYRNLLHHSWGLKDSVNGKVRQLDLNEKGNAGANKTAMDFVKLFDRFDNNNGGAILWVVHCEGSDYRTKSSFGYGCLVGSEDSVNSFAGLVDANTYMHKSNPSLATPEFIKLVNDGLNYLQVGLLNDDDTIIKAVLELQEE